MDEELRARLVAEAEAIINESVGQDEATQPRSVHEMEQAALKAGQAMKAAVLAGLVGHRPATSRADRCPECGET